MGVIKDLTGKKFGRLLVISIHGRTKANSVTWLCECDCGNETIVVGQNLTSKNTISCGCVFNEKVKTMNKKHGKRQTKVYKIWHSMKARCTNKNNIGYADYGGRGIKILWKSFEDFNDDMADSYKEGLTIERINVDGNYEPSNCKWATVKEQSNNKRNSRKVTINGLTDTVTNLCREYNISDRTVYSRIYSGWDEVRAIITPVKTK